MIGDRARIAELRVRDRMPWVRLISVLSGLWLLFACGLYSCGGAEQSTTQPVVTVKGYYSLSSEQVRKGHPVRIEGVVVYSDKKWRLFWMRGATGVLFRELPEGFDPPPARTKVILIGKTALIDGRRTIVDLKIDPI